MTEVRVQRAAAVRIDEIYKYTRERWGEAQADSCVTGMFEACGNIGEGTVGSRPIAAEFEVDGFWFRYRKHYVYWKILDDGTIGIVTVLHERMHQVGRMLEVWES